MKQLSRIILTFIVSVQINFAQVHSLKEKYSNYFPIGAAIGKKHLAGFDTTILKTHFAGITAENDMKPEKTLGQDGIYTFEAGDRLIKFAKKNNMLVRGHTLVWYWQTKDWFYQDDAGSLLSKDKMLQRMRAYIHNVMNHYKGAIYAWDVVNEAISDFRDKFYRDNITWFKICGADYIEMAFRYAHEADSTAKLFYNDYDLINPVKRDKVYKLVKELLAKGVPIHGIGMQGHWTLEDVNRKNLSDAIDLFASLGVDVQITELDISVYPYYHNIDRTLLPKEVKPFTDELDNLLANKYKEVFEVLRDKKDKITGVTFWGVADNNTWLSNFVVKGRTDYPLLFDAIYKPKKAFYAITDF